MRAGISMGTLSRAIAQLRNGRSRALHPMGAGSRRRGPTSLPFGMAASWSSRRSASSALSRKPDPHHPRSDAMSTETENRYAPKTEYDPRYDPLTDAGPGQDRDYAPTYWIATAGPAPADDGPVMQDMDAEVVVIGSGYTGLSCAIHLARNHGIQATVLEANGVAWGCSVRNGGHAQSSSGRRTRAGRSVRW